MVRNLDEDTVLNWYEAIEWAREGKKIRNSRWGSKDYYIYLNMDDVFVNEDGDRHAFDLPDFDEGTWEIYDPSYERDEAREGAKAEAGEPVAWMRYLQGDVFQCDKDRDDAFPVYTCPAPTDALPIESVARELARTYWHGRGEDITKEQEDEFWLSFANDARAALRQSAKEGALAVLTIAEALDMIKEYLDGSGVRARAFRDFEAIKAYFAENHLLDTKINVPYSLSGR